MVNPIPLAAGDLVPILIFLGFVGFILIASALANAAKGQGKGTRSKADGPRPGRGLGEMLAEAIRQQMEQGARQRSGSLPPPGPDEQFAVQRSVNQPRDQRQGEPLAVQRRAPNKRPARKVKPAVPPVTGQAAVAAVAPVAPVPTIPEAARADQARKSPPTATAGALHGWLHPTNLQRQFILTEIFQKPLALRQSED